jgi:hypothetical protein
LAERARIEERINELEGQLEDLKSGRRFARLIAERAASDEYRRQLGITAMIRRDFEEMSDLLRRSRKERSFPSEMDSKIPRIDRIILYIDDLDRCSADHVVEVLEAVHLLLAFPLFVVVVGVDPRWLLRSLEKHYSGLLTTTTSYLTHPDAEADWDATPMNYLEKIFQIPFTLLPMDPHGYRNLLEGLVPIRLTEGEHTGKLNDFRIKLKGIQSDAEETTSSIPERIRKELEAEKALKSEQEKKKEVDNIYQEHRERLYKESLQSIDVTPQSLQLEWDELNFMKFIGPLLDTPRAAKRLTNIYRLLRASLDDTKLEELINVETKTGDYPAVIILLGIVVGFPRLANFVFQKIDSSKNDDLWKDFVEGLRVHNAERGKALDPYDAGGKAELPLRNTITSNMTPDEAKLWQRLYMRIRRVEEDGGDLFPGKLAPYRRWIFKVARYSFHTGRFVVSGVRDR